MKMKTIGEIAEIAGGQITSRLEKKEVDDLFVIDRESDRPKIRCRAKVLVPKAISNAFVDKSSLMQIVCEKTSKENFDTEDLTLFVDESKITKADTLVLKLSTPYDACIITKDDENLLVSSFCASLKVTDPDVNLLYLLAFLNSNLFRDQIKNFVAGSSIPLVSVAAVKETKIPIPQKEEQEKIGTDFINTMKKIKLVNKIAALETEKLDSIFYGMGE